MLEIIANHAKLNILLILLISPLSLSEINANDLSFKKEIKKKKY